MIITKNWLNEWMDITDLSTDKICETLNAIGLEVDSVEEIRIPEKVVVGKVLTCEKHPDADKLQVCQVDIGTEVTQIVCGAKNVAKDQIVPVATIGADLGNNFIIKKAKLRGIPSSGMICGANEIGMPKMNDGILVLDESIGSLVLGKELCTYELFNDVVIDIELTANRGDCLSIRGVARDLSAALDYQLKTYEYSKEEDRRGIARVFNLDVGQNVDAHMVYRFMEIDTCRHNVARGFKLACVDQYNDDPFIQNITYVTHSSGVILRAYDFEALASKKLHELEREEKVTISLKKDAKGVDTVYCNGNVLSQVGLLQIPEYSYNNSHVVLLEASYIHPDIVSANKMEQKLKTDETFYHASRGSETDLMFGMDFLCTSLAVDCETKLYAGMEAHIVTSAPKILKINHVFIENFIGQKIDPSEIVLLLNRLGLQTQAVDYTYVIEVARFRPDITHSQDIIEEIVRMIGIDNIVSKPLQITENRQFNDAYDFYKKRTYLRIKASGSGFFESVHYFFDNKKLMQEYGMTCVDEKLDITNPISEELNTLRTTLVLHLIESASKNIKNGQRGVQLFELGRVVNRQRDEIEKMAFIASGYCEAANILNHGKPKEIDFFTFCDKLSSVIGTFTLEKAEDKNALVSPYEYANIIINGVNIGYIARVHINAEKAFDLPRTYICEVDFHALAYGKVIAKTYSKFPSLNRDLSLVIPKSLVFSSIREILTPLLPMEVQGFYPIDIYEDESLGDNQSVTVRFEIQSKDKTLTEEEIADIMNTILDLLQEKFQIGMR